MMQLGARARGKSRVEQIFLVKCYVSPVTRPPDTLNPQENHKSQYSWLTEFFFFLKAGKGPSFGVKVGKGPKQCPLL